MGSEQPSGSPHFGLGLQKRARIEDARRYPRGMLLGIFFDVGPEGGKMGAFSSPGFPQEFNQAVTFS